MPLDPAVDATRNEGFRFPCPVCGARIKAPKSRSGKAVECPRCGEQLRVPDFAEDQGGASVEAPETPAPVRRPKKKRLRPPVVRSEEETVVTPESRAPTGLLDRLGEVREETPDPPPKWTFLSGVFDVVLQPAAISRWLLLSAGLALTGLVGTIVLAMSGAIGFGAGGPPLGVAVAFFIVPLFWLGFYTFSYAAALGMTILEETAAGLNRITGWPEPNWKEWAGRLLPLMYLLALAAVPAWGLGELVRESQPERYWAVVGCVLGTLVPLFMLGSLETGSLWAPLSGVILGSLFPLWWAWLTYYTLAAVTLLFWVACVWIGWVPLKAPYLSAMATAPILAYVILVEARLLGRLAWRIGERGVFVDEDD